MRRLSGAFLELFKTFLPNIESLRSKPKPKIHFTKAEKSLVEMTEPERKQFAEKVVYGSLNSFTSQNQTNKRNNGSLVLFFTGILVGSVGTFIFPNLAENLPYFGDKHKAFRIVKEVCNAGTSISLTEKAILVERANSLDPKWARFATAYRESIVGNEVLKQLDSAGLSDSKEYVENYTKVISSVVTIEGTCREFREKNN